MHKAKLPTFSVCACKAGVGLPYVWTKRANNDTIQQVEKLRCIEHIWTQISWQYYKKTVSSQEEQRRYRLSDSKCNSFSDVGQFDISLMPINLVVH